MNGFLSFLKKAYRSARFRLLLLGSGSTGKAADDAAYIKRRFRFAMGKELNLENPETFNEKLQWLKLHDRNPQYTVMADKHRAKEYVAGQIGGQYVIPTIGVWENPDEIDFDALPGRFVLKCSHNSGLGMYICRDRSGMDAGAVRRGLRKGLKQDYYRTSREWPYRDVPRRIIAEQYMEDGSGGLVDYKVHCFHGVPGFILICSGRFGGKGLTEDFVTPGWERMPVRRPGTKTSRALMDKPEELGRMLELARKLSAGIPFVRVDFYIVSHQVFFSEMTFYPAAGFQPFEPGAWDAIFGSWLSLPDNIEK